MCIQTPTHLVVFQHGLHGVATCGDWFGNELKKSYGSDILYLTSDVNAGSWIQRFIGAPTIDGVDVCGRRLADNVRELVKANPSLTHISVSGLSMGGLIVRYACADLFDIETGLIGGLIPLNFVSFASPHLGVRKTIGSVLEVLGGFFVGRSFQHMTLSDCATEPGRRTSRCVPLLERMAGLQTPECQEDCGDCHPYLESLAAFKQRICIGNVHCDHQVPYPTATMVPFFHPAQDVECESKYPHITRVIHDEQLPDAKDSPTAWFDINDSHVPSPQIIFDDKSPEYRMLLSIREAMTWTRVDARFDGFVRLFSHDVVAVNMPYVSTAGQDVVRWVVDHLALPSR
eukprot:CFRG3315T1